MGKKRNYGIIGFQVLLAGGFFYFGQKSLRLFDMALKRNDFTAFTKFAEKTKELDIIRRAEAAEKESVEKFISAAPYEEYIIRGKDGVRLYGKAYYQKNYTSRWAVVVHGYSGDGEQMGLTAKHFYDGGFNVLLPDLRGHGRSGGRYIGMGWKDRMDIIEWVHKIIARDRQAAITLYGLSMGAATVLMASGEELPGNVRCVVEDCGYTSVSDQFCYHLRKRYHLPRFPIMTIAELICKLKAGYTFREASAIEQVRKCKVPILFIHGEKDEFVPIQMVYRLYRAARCQKELFIVPKAGHGVSANVGAKSYWRRIYAFTERYCG